MTFADLQFVCLLSFTDAPEDDLAIWVGVNICSAVFTLAINRLHSFKRQPFWFHSLNSMVPVKGIDLFY